jgi:hypothetical protein
LQSSHRQASPQHVFTIVRLKRGYIPVKLTQVDHINL